MMFRCFLLCAAFAAGISSLAGCTTIDSVKDARGQGVKRIFYQSYDEVFAATLNAAARRNLEVVSSQRESGTLLLAHGAALGSLGERIAVFVTRVNDRTVSVEVVARPVLATLGFPPDWPGLLFADIDEELAVRRLKR